VLYFHRISDNRWAGKPDLDGFDELCGENASQMIHLVTTMWDDHKGHASQGEKEQREEELRSEHWKAMLDKGSAIARYERTSDSAWSALKPFLQAANRRKADLVLQEIADMRRRRRKSKADRESCSRLEVLVKHWYDQRQNIRAEIHRQGDGRMLLTLKAKYESTQRELASAMSEARTLDLPLRSHVLALLRTPAIA